MHIRPGSAALLMLAGGAVMAAGLTPAAAVSTRAPAFKTVKLAGSLGRSEPRVTILRNGTEYAVTNATPKNSLGFGLETVYRSPDGVHWKKTVGQPGNQTEATTDVDIVSTPSGRVVSSELDYGGINFRTDYSDDGGKTWTTSVGNTYADTDRQWYAVGPNDPTTHKPRVYLLFHDLLSGTVQHNMFVATSTDGGATFGPPIPVAVPGQQDYADLQCADSGGPSNIVTDPRNGTVYVVFGTRSSSSPLSGCTAQPTEVNVVAANRVWVVSAPASQTATPGGWTPHLAVNDTGPPAHIVGMQLAPGAVDDAGNVYVAYPESIHDYPDYDGAAIKVIHASPRNLDRWSKPSVVAAAGGAGNILPHIVAGAPGRVDVAWYHGVAVKGAKPNWYSYAAQSLDALSAHPHWTPVRLSPVLGEGNSTASTLMGACMQGQQATLNGFVCGRSTDVNGLAIDRCGRLTVIWPAQAGAKTDGTYVSRQVGGPALRTCRTRTTAGVGSGTTRSNEPAPASHDVSSAAAASLPTTGSSPWVALAGAALLVAGLLVGRLRFSRRARSRSTP